MDNELCNSSDEESNRLVEELLKPGQTITELLINTTYLLDTWICEALPILTGDPNFLRDNRMTEDQRFYFFLGQTGVLLEKELGGRLFFTILRHAYRLKAMLNRIPEAEIMKEVYKLDLDFKDISVEEIEKVHEIIEEQAELQETLETEDSSIAFPTPVNDAEAVESLRDILEGAVGFCWGYIHSEPDDTTCTP